MRSAVSGWLAMVCISVAQQEVKELSLADCVGLALKQNPVLAAARQGAEAAGFAVEESNAGYYPRIGANAGYSRWSRLAFLPGGLVLPPAAGEMIGPTDDWVVGLNAQWTLFDSGERGGRREAATAMRKALDATAWQVRQDTLLSVYEAFFECLAAGEFRRVADETFARAVEHLRLAGERVKAGAAAQGDELRAQVESANARLGVFRAEGRYRVAQGRLNTVMGGDAEVPIRVVDAGTEVSRPGGQAVGAAMELCMRNRPDLQAARRRVEAARGDLLSARSGLGPKVVLQGAYDRREGDLAGPGDEWLVGVSLDMPLFAGFGTVRRIARCEAVLAQAESLAKAQELAVRQEVWAAQSRWLESYELVSAVGSQVADAKESVRRATERYRAGAGILSDLLDAEVALERAESTRIEARKDCRVAAAAYKRALGTLEAVE